ncbi:retrovirus-related pol polyprotein from transposon TNT 1-94 [Tanacetum coccineum]
MNNYSSVSKGFQPKFTPKLIQSSSNSNSQADPKFQKDYKDEYKKIKAKLALLKASPLSSQNPKTFQPKNKGLVAETFDWDEEEVSDEEEVIQVKVLMALADDKLTVGKSHARNDWVERLNPDSKLPNFNTGSILVPESKVVSESLEPTETLNTHDSSKDSKAESLTQLPPLKNLQGASPNSKVTPLTFQPHSPRERPGLETHQGAHLVPRQWMLKEYDWCQELSAQICKATRNLSKFTSPYTPEQNGVAERKNKTLIEAARTMLNGSVLSKHFWTEAVRIAYYTQNISIIVKRHDKTPYEIFRERIPDIQLLFKYVILSLKSFRILQPKKQQVEEIYHVTFDESMEAIRFTNTSVDEIGIDDSLRYPPDEFLQKDDPSRQYSTLICDNNCTVEFDAFGFSVKDFLTRHFLLRCDSSGDLYPVTQPSPTPHALLSVSPSTWHQRLGHPGEEVLRSLVFRQFISCNKEKSHHICRACQLGKHVRLLFSSSDSVVTHCFEIVHSDIWTSPIASSGAFKYYVLFLDHYSHYLLETRKVSVTSKL